MSLSVHCPDGRVVQLPSDPSRSLAAVLEQGGLHLDRRCGDKGRCGSCRVEILEGEVICRDDGRRVMAPALVSACRHAAVGGSLRLAIPARSLLTGQATMVDLMPLAPPAAPARPLADGGLGLAVDIGTTTVVVALVDVRQGLVLDGHGAFNAQLRLGDDMIARIQRCRADASQVAALQQAVVEDSLAGLVARLAPELRARITSVTMVGNTTMLHLLLGVDPSPLGVVPFTPVFLDHRRADDLAPAIGLASGTPVHVLPGASAYIGADVLAGVVACGLDLPASGARLLIDVGTNGEMVLACDGRLTACATAAGPAFEGCGLSCGSRAQAGAVGHVRWDAAAGSLVASVLPGAAACGLCGSAYVDLLAVGRAIGAISSVGRLDPEHPAVVQVDGRARLPVVADLFCDEADIARLLTAKAAIAAGVDCLLEDAGLAATDLDEVLIAGGFGRHLAIDHALAIGLVPAVDPQRVTVIGNSALSGAAVALGDDRLPCRMAACAQAMRIIELNGLPAFEMAYIERMQL